MVKLSLESKIEHKHQQCDEMLSTFMKIMRVNKIMNIGNKSKLMKCERGSTAVLSAL